MNTNNPSWSFPVPGRATACAAFSPQEIADAKARQGLLTMELELSRQCNLRCIYCYSEAGEPLPNELTPQEIDNVVDQAHALGAKRIIVLGGGEPLMHPHVMNVIRHIAALGMEVELFTNGMFITPHIAEEFVRLRVKPVVKMNSLRPLVQDLLAGQKGAAGQIAQGLECLRAAGYPGPELPLGIQSVICRQNLDELPQMWAWAKDSGMRPYFEMITLQGRAKKHSELEVSIQELRTLFETLSALDRERYDEVWEPRPPIAGYSCNRHGYTCTITVQGDVLPCPGVDIPVGNIRQQPLAEILRTSEVIAALRDVHARLKGACGQCPENHSCYGCRGMAYQFTGDYLAADPLCWKGQKVLP